MSLKSTNNIEKNKVELEIEVSAEAFEEALQKAYLKAKKNISVPGFRKGKATRKLIEKTYGENVFFEDAVNMVYGPEVDAAVKEADLELVARPDVEIVSVDKETGISMKAVCITKPEVEVKDYKGIEVEKTVKTVSDEDIDKEVNKIREKNMRMITIDDRAAEIGDVVTIDFEGFKDDVAFEGGKGEDFDLELGSHQFIPGFEEAVAGHNIGEQFDINVTFPEEYQVADLAGAPVVFKINLKAITKKELPEADDEMIKDSTEFESLEEFKADAKKKLEEANEKVADAAVEDKLFETVVGNMTAEIPDVMYENRANEMVNELAQRLKPQGISIDLYCQYTGQTIESLKNTYMEQAQKQVKLRLALEQIVKNEGIEASEEEINTELNNIAETYKLTVDQVKMYINEKDVAKDVAVGKAVDLIKNSAVIKM